MKNKSQQTTQTSAAILIVGILTIFSQYSFAQEFNKNLPQSKQTLNKFKGSLIPMPIGDLNSALSNVNAQRNPFQKPLESEITNTDDLYLTLKFKGLAKSGNNILAIIESNNNQKFYSVGETLDNGFLIKSISFENISVDISNGSKNYRLMLNKYNKSL